MGVIKFALTMLKKEMKQSIFFMVSMIFSTAVIFNIFNLLFNHDFMDVDTNTTTAEITIVVIIAALLFIAVANLYFMYGKTKTLAIALISGRSVYSVGMLLGVQNIILGVIGGTVGIVFGFATLPLTNYFVYSAIGETIKLMAFSSLGISSSVAVLIIELAFMSLADIGYAYKMEIVDLLNDQKIRNNKKSKGVLPEINHLFYWFLYLIPILCLFLPITIEDKSKLVPIAEILVMLGTFGLIKTSIPNLIKKIKRKYFQYDKIKSTALSNLLSSLEESRYAIIYLLIGVTFLISKYTPIATSEIVRVIIIASYIVITVIMAITMIYKVLIEGVNRKNSFKQLKLIGYTNDKIKKVLSLEVSSLYLIVIIIPTIQILAMMITNSMAGTISYTLVAALLGIYMGIFGLSYIISLIGYKRIIFKVLEEVK